MKTTLMPFSFLALLPIAAHAQKRPNILYIMTDDHTTQMMSCYDKTHVQTPNLDRIARDGVRFVNSFVANSLSGPIMSTVYLMAVSKPCQNFYSKLDTAHA